MFGGLNRLLVAAAVAGAAFAVVLAGPSAALAGCNGGASAVNVYKECQPSGGGGSTQTGSGSHSSGPTTPVTISGPAARAIKHAGKDSRALASVMRTGPEGLLHSNPSGVASKPSTVGSAFDLGSGPTALLIALAATAVLLLGGSGLRVWHRRRP